MSPDSKFNILNSILKSPISFSKFVFVLPNRNCCFKLLPQWLYLKTPFLSFTLKNAETGHGAATSTSHYSSGLDLVPNTPTPLATTCKFQFQRIQHSLLASTGTHIHTPIHRHIFIIKNKTKIKHPDFTVCFLKQSLKHHSIQQDFPRAYRHVSVCMFLLMLSENNKLSVKQKQQLPMKVIKYNIKF